MNRSAFSPVGTTIACATLLLLGGTRLAAQEEGGSVQPPGPVVTVDGRASISVEAWHSEAEEGIPDDSVARRPPLFTRIELAPEFHIGHHHRIRVANPAQQMPQLRVDNPLHQHKRRVLAGPSPMRKRANPRMMPP